MSSFGYRKDEISFEFETLEEIDNLKAVRVNPGINLPRKQVSILKPNSEPSGESTQKLTFFKATN